MTVKDRIREYIEYKNISRYKFYKDTGVSNGYLDKQGSPTTDIIAIILSTYKDLNIIWLLTGEGDMTISNSGGIQGDNSIQNTGTMANSYVGSGNYINVSLPNEGTQKIIKPDGTVEIISTNPDLDGGIVAEGSPVYGMNVGNLQEQVQLLKEQIDAYKNIIEEQKDFIRLLKENK